MKIIREGKYVRLVKDMDGDFCIFVNTDKGGSVRLDCIDSMGAWDLFYFLDLALSTTATVVG